MRRGIGCSGLFIVSYSYYVFQAGFSHFQLSKYSTPGLELGVSSILRPGAPNFVWFIFYSLSYIKKSTPPAVKSEAFCLFVFPLYQCYCVSSWYWYFCMPCIDFSIYRDTFNPVTSRCRTTAKQFV